MRMSPLTIALVAGLVLVPLLAFAAGAKVDFGAASGAAQTVLYALQGRTASGAFPSYPGGTP